MTYKEAQEWATAINEASGSTKAFARVAYRADPGSQIETEHGEVHVEIYRPHGFDPRVIKRDCTTESQCADTLEWLKRHQPVLTASLSYKMVEGLVAHAEEDAKAMTGDYVKERAADLRAILRALEFDNEAEARLEVKA